MMLSFALSILLFASSALSQSSSHPTFAPSVSLSGQPISSASSASASLTNSAQLPSLTGYSTCLDSCFDNAVASTGCDSVAEVDCFCARANVTTFENALVNCMSTQCPSSLSTVESVAQQFCNVAASSISLSFPAPSLTPTSSTPASSPSTSATSPPTSSAASSHSASATSTIPSTSTSGAEQIHFVPLYGYVVLMAVAASMVQWA